MLKFVRAFISGVRISIHWVKALDAATLGKYEEAKQSLKKIESIGYSSYLEYCLLRAFVEYRLGSNKDSLYFVEEALCAIPKEKKHYNDEELKYFEAYAKWISNLQVSDEKKLWDIDFMNIDLKKVSKPFLDNHPLNVHPMWRDYYKPTK